MQRYPDFIIYCVGETPKTLDTYKYTHIIYFFLFK